MRVRTARGMLLGLTIAVGFSVGPLSGASGDTPPGLNAAIRDYEGGNVERAERLLTDLTARLQGAPRARAWLYLGLAQAGRGKLDAARRSFATALRLGPSLDIDRERVAPPVIKVFDEVRGRVTGVLRISAPEKGARVLVDGKERGAVPLDLRLGLGEHRVQVRSADARRASPTMTVRVGAGAITRVRAVLHALVGRVALRVQPPGTRVLLGKRSLAAPGGVLTLPAGEHVLTFQQPGFAPASRSVRVDPGKTVPLDVRLLALTARPFWTPARTWGVTTGGLAVALGVTGLILGSSAKSAEDDIRTGQQAQTLTYDQYLTLADKASSRARWANVLLGVAGAAAVTSVVLLITGRRDQRRDTSQTAWRLFPTAGGAGVSVDF